MKKEKNLKNKENLQDFVNYVGFKVGDVKPKVSIKYKILEKKMADDYIKMIRFYSDANIKKITKNLIKAVRKKFNK